jgi:microsomal epoxide hydrolase
MPAAGSQRRSASVNMGATTIESFLINIPTETLHDLGRRLTSIRWPDEVGEAGWDYGTNLDYLRELCAYWSTGFDWRAPYRP